MPSHTPVRRRCAWVLMCQCSGEQAAGAGSNGSVALPSARVLICACAARTWPCAAGGPLGCTHARTCAQKAVDAAAPAHGAPASATPLTLALLGPPSHLCLLVDPCAGWDHTHGPPPDKWERATSDAANQPRTWGLKARPSCWRGQGGTGTRCSLHGPLPEAYTDEVKRAMCCGPVCQPCQLRANVEARALPPGARPTMVHGHAPCHCWRHSLLRHASPRPN